LSLISRARKWLSTRRYAYRQTFSHPYSDVVLHDLATFCFAHKSPSFKTDREYIMAEGRRQVWLRIAAHLQLNEEQTWDYFDGRIDVPE
jgi:uncharacterized protein (DUF2461 family)